MLHFLQKGLFLCRKFLRAAARWHLCAFKLKAFNCNDLVSMRVNLFFFYKIFSRPLFEQCNKIVIPVNQNHEFLCSAMLNYKERRMNINVTVWVSNGHLHWGQTGGKQLKRGDMGIATHFSDYWTLKQPHLRNKYIAKCLSMLMWRTHLLLSYLEIS